MTGDLNRPFHSLDQFFRNTESESRTAVFSGYGTVRLFKSMKNTGYRCLIHPDTAAEHGVLDGGKVRVFNKSGEITVPARFDPTIRPGICSIPHGHKHANVNNLTSTHDIDPLGGMALYSAVPITIEPA